MSSTFISYFINKKIIWWEAGTLDMMLLNAKKNGVTFCSVSLWTIAPKR
jgi:hypothetical protein